MSKAAATLFERDWRIETNPLVWQQHTGCLYQELVKMYEAGDLDFSQVTTFNLDEYIGLEA